MINIVDHRGNWVYGFTMIELDLIPAPGRRAETQVEKVRSLVPADAALLARGGPSGAGAPAPVAKLRESHHALARILATGADHIEASAVSGYTPQRIGQLLNDPSFKDLLEVYRREANNAYADLHVRMAALADDTIEEIHDRLRDTPEQFDLHDLRETAKLVTDRIGYGPQTKATNVNVHIGLADRLDAARRRMKEVRAVKVED